ncbi:hypothetical protein BDW60DRAFT_223786 [Aspergillus nidulans var. acristatus]
MVSLQAMLSHNAGICSSLPAGLVAVFVGATSGIGAATLKAFAKYTRVPRAYFVGRSQTAADTIIAECKALNPGGEYVFIEADISLIRTVDEVCARIKARETRLDILFLSQGTASLERNMTPEGLHLLTALTHYSRTRFTANLLPLLEHASCLRRVVTVGAAGFEGPINTSDFGGLQVAPRQVRGHVATLITLGLEALARHAPSVSFVHSYPGTVDTPLTRRVMSSTGAAPMDWMNPTESGERHLYLLTSSRYPGRNEDAGLAQLNGDGVSDPDVIRGTDGKLGSGVYAVGLDGECVSMETLGFLDTLRKREMVDLAWEHTVGEFERIARTV